MMTTPALVWVVLIAGPAAGDLATSNVQQVYRSDALNAWCVSPNVKVFRDHRLPRRTVDPVVRLRAARGEHEPLQLVIQNERGLKGLSLRFTPARTSLRWNPIGFIDVAQTSTRRTLGKGAYPDALLKSRIFDLQPEANGLVWITASVPNDAAAGEQRSSVAVQQGDRELLAFQLVLDVWDFTLPRKMPLVIQGNFWCREPWFRRHTDRDLRELAKEYFVNMAEHRIDACPTVWPFPAFLPGEELDDKAEELREFETMATFVLDELGFKRFRFPYSSAAGGMATGAWRGHEVMTIPAEPGDVWISGTRVKKRHLAATYPGARWMGAWGMRLMLGQVPDANAFDGSWIEYELRTERAGVYRCWLEGRYRCPVEVTVDGASLGAVDGSEGFKQAPEAIDLAAGTHRLRLTIPKAKPGEAAYIRRLFLSCRADADPAKLIEQRRASKEFLSAYGYHLRTAGRYLAERGWLAKAHVKIGDEPQEQAYPVVCDAARAVREALPSEA